MQARNRGAAVLLVSEDLDEILELADRILVISGGKIVYETTDRGRRPPRDRHVTWRATDASHRREPTDADHRRPALRLHLRPGTAGAGDHRHAARLPGAGRLRRGAGQRRPPSGARRARRRRGCCEPSATRAHRGPHQGMPSARPVRLPAGQAAARPRHAAHRRHGPDGPHPDRRRAGQRFRRRRSSRGPGEVVIAKPGKGAFYATPLAAGTAGGAASRIC